MRTISRVSLTAAVSAALVGSVALPATAAPTADSTVTVEVPVGTLSISAPATAALGTVTPGASASVGLAGVQITDDRAGVAGWSAQVALTDFVGVNAANVIPATAATYTPEAATVTGTATVAETPASNLSTAKTVQTATAVSGNNTATWNASLSILAPAGALADTYTATLTHSSL